MSVLFLLGNRFGASTSVATSYKNLASVTFRKHRSMRSLLMLLFYLAYFALLLETGDDNENVRASNRARRKKKYAIV